MSRAIRASIAIAIVLGTAGALAVALSGGDSAPNEVRTPAQATAATCQPPNATTPDARPDPALSSPAAVSAPGARTIDTGGLAPDAVAGAEDAPAWAIMRDSRVVQAPVGRIARVDPDAGVLAQVVDVVTGCTVTSLAASGTNVWAGTCEFAGATTGAELVEVHAPDGVIGRRIPVPAACLVTAAATASDVWAANAASVDVPSTIFRVRGDATTAESALALGSDESLLGLAADGDAAWVSIQGATATRLVRIDATNTASATVPTTGANRLLGIVDGTLWAQDLAASALVGRDATSGEVTHTVPISGLVSAAVGGHGVWYQTASAGSTTVTIGRLDANAAPTSVTTYTSAAVDRTGAPLTGLLSVTTSGAWLSIQDRLFLLPA